MKTGDRVRVKDTAEYFRGVTGTIVEEGKLFSPPNWIIKVDNHTMEFVSGLRGFWERDLELLDEEEGE